MQNASRSDGPGWPGRLALGAFVAAVIAATGASVRQAHADGPDCIDYNCINSEECKGVDCVSCDDNLRCAANRED